MNAQHPEKKEKNQVRLFVDAHVHIHDCFEVEDFLDATAANFSHHAKMAGNGVNSRYILCLTESSGINRFAALRSTHSGLESSDSLWTCRPGVERECVIANHPDRGEIIVVAGRQIVTAERLEVLGLGLLDEVEDGLPISEVVRLVANREAIPVVPWGFGKWLGARRQVINSLLESVGKSLFYLGDNSGRPGMISAPSEFLRAARLGIRILPGSDPLPFASEIDRAGSFGFYVDGVGDSERVWTELRTMLQDGTGDLHQYGSLESPIRFVRNQVAMQYLNRFLSKRNAV